MKLVPWLNAGEKRWTPVVLFGVIERLPFRSSVRSQVQTSVQNEPVMRRYAISCEFYRAKQAAALADCIRKLAHQWEHPIAGVWLVTTTLSAGELRSALLPHLGFQDRLYICEAGEDKAEFNVLPTGGGKAAEIENTREKSRIVAGIFSRNGRSSRHLKAATPKNLRSA
jgi:hypothetical protein